MKVTRSRTGGLAALAKRLSYVASGGHRKEATAAGARPLAAIVHAETGAHVKSGRLARSAQIIVDGESIRLVADYDAGVTGKPRISRKTGKIIAGRKGAGPAVYMRFGGPHGGPGLSFGKGFRAVHIRAAREAYIAVLRRALLGS